MGKFFAYSPIQGDFENEINDWPIFLGYAIAYPPVYDFVLLTDGYYSTRYEGDLILNAYFQPIGGTVTASETSAGATRLFSYEGVALDFGTLNSLLSVDAVLGTESGADYIAQFIDEAYLSTGADRFVEVDFNEIYAQGGNDFALLRGLGSVIDGGAGVDTAVIKGPIGDYAIEERPDGGVAINGVGFSNVLYAFEYLEVGGQRLDLSDIGPDPVSLSLEQVQTVALLYEAGLNRDGAIGVTGLNFWIDKREGGLSEKGLAQRFLASAEFEAAFGDALDPTDPDYLTDRELVEQLFLNVLDRPGASGGVTFWTNRVAASDFDRADLLLAFAKSPENVAGADYLDTLTEVAPGEWDFVA